MEPNKVSKPTILKGSPPKRSNLSGYKNGLPVLKDSLMVRLLGTPAMVRTIDYFIDNQGLLVDRQDVMDGAHISHATATRTLVALEEWGVIGRARDMVTERVTYWLAKNSEIAQALMKLDFTIASQYSKTYPSKRKEEAMLPQVLEVEPMM